MYLGWFAGGDGGFTVVTGGVTGSTTNSGSNGRAGKPSSSGVHSRYWVTLLSVAKYGNRSSVKGSNSGSGWPVTVTVGRSATYLRFFRILAM